MSNCSNLEQNPTKLCPIRDVLPSALNHHRSPFIDVNIILANVHAPCKMLCGATTTEHHSCARRPSSSPHVGQFLPQTSCRQACERHDVIQSPHSRTQTRCLGRWHRRQHHPCQRARHLHAMGAATTGHHSCARRSVSTPNELASSVGEAEHDAVVARTDVKDIVADVHTACCGSASHLWPCRHQSHYSCTRPC